MKKFLVIETWPLVILLVNNFEQHKVSLSDDFKV